MPSERPVEPAILKSLVENALPLAGSARAAFVESVGKRDEKLRTELEAVLRGHDKLAAIQYTLSGGIGACDLCADGPSQQDRTDHRIGTAVGQYQITDILGSGGMGTVYRAERQESGFCQVVALKIVEGQRWNPLTRQRFEHERQLLANLHHPNIASLLDGGTTSDGRPYYTMELVDGVDLLTYCRTNQSSIERRVRLLISVAEALSYAHRNLIVHRDIKPPNILVSANGQVKLLDFGIAKLVGPAEIAGLTRSCSGPMTPEYAAPEQFRGRAITVATDIFQFGTLCYRVLAGALPYATSPGNRIAWAHAVSEDAPIPLWRSVDRADSHSAWQPSVNRLQLRRRLRGDLSIIVHKSMAKDPNDRYGSMEMMAADLRAYLAHRPVAARRASLIYPIRRFVERHRLAVAGSSGLIVLLFGAVAIVLRNGALAAQAADRDDAAVRFIASVFEEVDPVRNSGSKLTAQTILDRAEQRLADVSGAAAVPRGQLELIIAQGYLALGDQSRALHAAQQAIAALQHDAHNEPRLLATALVTAAELVLPTGHSAEVRKWTEQADSLLILNPHAPDLQERLRLVKAAMPPADG